jgi:copper oxidase (laccase) domain-containing protein
MRGGFAFVVAVFIAGAITTLPVTVRAQEGRITVTSAAPFTRTFGERWSAWAKPSRAGHVMLDLWSANEALLIESGVQPTSIENARLCTACRPDLLYSYRRGNRGRLVTLAALP